MAETSLPPLLAELAGFLLAKAHALFHARADRGPGPGELGIKHFGCLTVIADEGRLSQQYLCDRMRVDRTTMVAVVDDLEAAGLVDRRATPTTAAPTRSRQPTRGAPGSRRSAGALIAAQDGASPCSPRPSERQLVAILQRLLVASRPNFSRIRR